MFASFILCNDSLCLNGKSKSSFSVSAKYKPELNQIESTAHRHAATAITPAAVGSLALLVKDTSCRERLRCRA